MGSKPSTGIPWWGILLGVIGVVLFAVVVVVVVVAYVRSQKAGNPAQTSLLRTEDETLDLEELSRRRDRLLDALVVSYREELKRQANGREAQKVRDRWLATFERIDPWEDCTSRVPADECAARKERLRIDLKERVKRGYEDWKVGKK